MTDMGTDQSVFWTHRREHFWSLMTDVGRGLSAPLGTYLRGDIFKALNTFNGRHFDRHFDGAFVSLFASELESFLSVHPKCACITSKRHFDHTKVPL